MSLKALLFDLDGTLADTDPVHMAVFAEILAPLGYVVDKEFYRTNISGGRNEELFKRYFPQKTADELAWMAEDKEARFRQRMQGLKPVAGLEKILGWAGENGLGLGLVTNAPRANVDFMLRELGLEEAFGIHLLADEVGKGKPDPAPYRAALELLGIRKEEAVVFEDSGTGIRSSVGAGVFTYGVRSTHLEAELLAAGADATIADFNDPALWESLAVRLYDA